MSRYVFAKYPCIHGYSRTIPYRESIAIGIGCFGTSSPSSARRYRSHLKSELYCNAENLSGSIADRHSNPLSSSNHHLIEITKSSLCFQSWAIRSGGMMVKCASNALLIQNTRRCTRHDGRRVDKRRKEKKKKEMTKWRARHLIGDDISLSSTSRMSVSSRSLPSFAACFVCFRDLARTNCPPLRDKKETSRGGTGLQIICYQWWDMYRAN